jgi:hypothetical protein
VFFGSKVFVGIKTVAFKNTNFGNHTYTFQSESQCYYRGGKAVRQ